MAPQKPRATSNFVETYFRMASLTVPAYAVLTAVLVGSMVMLVAGANPVTAYIALADGALGSGEAIANTLGRSTPYIICSLAVALGFKAGLFNIGAEGQLLVGALAAGWAGTFSWLAELPPVVAIPVMLLAGLVGGLLWGGIPGVLKARTGAHEVIVTIMLNNVARRMAEWLIASREPVILLDTEAAVAHSVPIAESARLARIIPDTALHWGFFIAVGLCVGVWFLLQRTTKGFEIRTVGLNANAARYAGINVNRIIVVVLAASGALAGLAGAGEVSGGTAGAYYLTPGILANIGFDSIAIALLARGNPFAIIPASLLWSALIVGGPVMQVRADVSLDIVKVVQALIILFVAADAIVRYLFRIRKPHTEASPLEPGTFAKGWGA